MNKTLRIAALILTTLALTGSSVSHAWDIQKAPQYAAGMLFAASILKYFNTKPNNDPVRYDLCELANFKNVLNNLKYLVIDGIIGHGEEKAKIMVDKDGYVVLDESKKAPAKGLYGNIHATYLKPILKTLGFVATMRATVNEIDTGVKAWQSFQFSDLVPTFAKPTIGYQEAAQAA